MRTHGVAAARRPARTIVLGAALPLAGARARALGDSLALRVAMARLRALGCSVEASGGAPPPTAPAGWIGLTGLPFPLDEAEPGCAVSWSGPVALPMEGERDVQAACGIEHVHGRAEGRPRPLGVDYASVCAGVLCAQAVTATALALARGGPALSASTSLAQAALLSLTQYVAAATADGADPDPGPGRAEAAPEGPRAPRGPRTPPFRSADGVVFELETLDGEAWRELWSRLGADPGAIAAGWPPFQRRFATATCRLPDALGAAAAALDYERVRAAAGASGVSVVPVRTAGAPRYPVPASPWRLRAQTRGRGGHALPPLGPRAGAPLAGIRVVEATTRVQGPLTGHLLGLLGADVVRVEPPGGDPMRGVPPMAGPCSARFLALNRGKDAVEADLKTERGRRTVLELVSSAHVFLHNWPPGRAERLGLGPGDLMTARPSLVHVHTGGWADALPAPQPLGTDYLVQAHSGVAALVNGPGEPAAPSLMTITDVLGGVIGAEGAVAALLAHSRTGSGVRAETALTDAARLLLDTAGAPAAAHGRPARTATTTDLAAMAADPAFTAAFDTDSTGGTGGTGGTAYARAPWSFRPAAVPVAEEVR
jgi:crotonobetainyl-CoA:carnitine CoA-transferase CaiB-like acyl-CoA transferase